MRWGNAVVIVGQCRCDGVVMITAVRECELPDWDLRPAEDTIGLQRFCSSSWLLHLPALRRVEGSVVDQFAT